ncbi:MAG: acyl carrier protein [Bacteroidota bacterium]|nr:acyl carrier protein [Bacteroidota bacterium]
MKEKEISEFIINHLADRLKLLGISEREIQKDFDFVQSGLLDSMAFVDMITAMEEKFGHEVDFEAEAEDGVFTTMQGVMRMFLKNE